MSGFQRFRDKLQERRVLLFTICTRNSHVLHQKAPRTRYTGRLLPELKHTAELADNSRRLCAFEIFIAFPTRRAINRKYTTRRLLLLHFYAYTFRFLLTKTNVCALDLHSLRGQRDLHISRERAGGRKGEGERREEEGCRSHKINIITRDAVVPNNRNGGRKNETRDETRTTDRSRKRRRPLNSSIPIARNTRFFRINLPRCCRAFHAALRPRRSSSASSRFITSADCTILCFFFRRLTVLKVPNSPAASIRGITTW